MKKVAFLTLILLTATLAGCTSSDDAEVQVELTNEQIDGIIEAHLQDFVNNTTSSQTNYFIVDHIFTKADLFIAPEEIDHINNSFNATYVEYNVSMNENTNFTYQLDCEGYYLVGLQTTPVTYWQNSTNYMQAWVGTYNQTIADLYQEYSSLTTVRFTCDENYNPNGSQTGSLEMLTILDITIPAGKGLMCENTGIIKMLDVDTNEYVAAKGELLYPTNPNYGDISSTLSYQFDSFSSGISCTAMTLGSGSADTMFSIMTQDRMLDYDDQYRIYLVYTLVDVEDHIV